MHSGFEDSKSLCMLTLSVGGLLHAVHLLGIASCFNTLVVVPFKTAKRPETSSESGGSKKSSAVACYQS